MKSNEERERIIQALLAKTTEAGATEDEALQASQKAKELMDKHQISMSESELMAEGMDEFRFSLPGSYEAMAARIISTAVCNWLGVYLIRHTQNKTLTLIGLKPDVELAKWLIGSLWDYVCRGAKAHAKDTPSRRVHAYAASARIVERIKEMAKEGAKEGASNMSDGRSLVVVKDALARDEAYRRYAIAPARKGRKLTVDASHADDWRRGRAHGDKAQFNKPVNSGGAKILSLPSRN